MLFYIKNKQLLLCTLDFLFIASIFYCGYGILWLDEKGLYFKEPVIIILTITSFWIYKKFFSNSKDEQYVSLEINLKKKIFS